MYYAFIKDNKLDGCGECCCLTDGVENVEISEEIFNNIAAYTWNGSGVVIDDNDTAQKEQIRALRDEYLAQYVDWYQSKPLLWEEMSEKEKSDIADYRQYLKDYTKQENWWKQKPLTFDEWKQIAGEVV